MRPIARTRRRPRQQHPAGRIYRAESGRSSRSEIPLGTLPVFSRPVGLDFIITPAGETVLVELQLGFGRLGLYRLFPRANRLLRKTSWYLRHESGRQPWLTWRLRRICNDKIKTYRLFADLQPPSLAYGGWDEGVERWLAGLQTRFVLLKPPRGSCGEGIEVFEREALLRSSGVLIPPGLALPQLLQAFVQSRILRDDVGRPHVGCIRHIVIMHSDGERLSFIHLPAYWRVSPATLGGEAYKEALTLTPDKEALALTPDKEALALTPDKEALALTPDKEALALTPDKEALTANISRGAVAVALEPREEEQVRQLAEGVCARLICHVLGLEGIEQGTRDAITPDGELCGELGGALMERIEWR
jgi:hypothetical protein